MFGALEVTAQVPPIIGVLDILGALKNVSHLDPPNCPTAHMNL